MFKFGKKKTVTDDVESRVALIRSLGEPVETKGKKKTVDNEEANFGRLLTFLTDASPECRIAAAEMLGKTSRDDAITQISHYLGSEKDEKVAAAMRAAISSIRANIQQ